MAGSTASMACALCGGLLDGDDIGFGRDTCHACRSPQGKIADLGIAIRASGDSPARIKEWPAIRHLLRKRFGEDHSDVELWERCTDWLQAEGRLEPNAYLVLALDQLQRLLKNGFPTGGQAPPSHQPRTFSEIGAPDVFAAVVRVKADGDAEAEKADCLAALSQHKEETYPSQFGSDDEPLFDFLALTKFKNGDQEFAFIRWGYVGRDAAHGAFARLINDSLASLPETAGDTPVFGGPALKLDRTNIKRWLRLVFTTLAGKGSYVRDYAGKVGPVKYLAVPLQTGSDVTLEASCKKTKPAGKAKRKRRPSDKRAALTEKQSLVMQIVGEYEGNITKAAKKLNRDGSTVKQHYEAALKKLGRAGVKILGRNVAKHTTGPLANDRRGQPNIAENDDKRRG